MPDDQFLAKDRKMNHDEKNEPQRHDGHDVFLPLCPLCRRG